MSRTLTNPGPPPHPPPPTVSTANWHLISVISREKLHANGDNYLDWIRNLRVMCSYGLKEYVLEPNRETTDSETITEWTKHFEDANKVTCVMVTAMERNLAERFENSWAYEINKECLARRQDLRGLRLLNPL